MAAAAFTCSHSHVKAVWFDHHAVAPQEILFSGKLERVDFPVEPFELDG